VIRVIIGCPAPLAAGRDALLMAGASGGAVRRTCMRADREKADREKEGPWLGVWRTAADYR
jgi:hypothetical protein